ncbi:DNA polymerase I, thermostable [Gemmata sp. SH-PL17]|uniref:DNA polymerase n=1 Tax=Gemmata sp. SH-PL17 TaxID=1630693 RepID=UPI00078CD9F4|nr:DNA polymerase [Gemmata sp. SH-PL17]AMV28822.1 DNA polymerase I, thermostable [Gemmata sp. SH-PL17]
MHWNHPAPVFIDLETQSACDLKEAGGRVYAADPSTRIMTAVFWIDGAYHVWVPRHTTDATTFARMDVAQMWPRELGAPDPIVLHFADVPPEPAQAAIRAGRPFVAHNAFGFDQHVWRGAVVERGPAWNGNVDPQWLDTLPLARAGGYPGRLNAIAQEVAGAGKDAGHRILMKFIQADVEGSEIVYKRPGVGDLQVICRYNVVDVELLRRVWGALEPVPVEADVIEAHRAVNHRGVRVDVALATSLSRVAGESVQRAGTTIEKITNGELKQTELRSVQKVNAWLDAKGVRIRDYGGKRTLRKDFVNQAIANPWLMLEDDSPVAAVADIDPLVFEVLRLRGAAIRITGGKSERAVMRAGRDGRARDLHTYWQAHTGRWSSAGIQVHNLPRPKKGVPVLDLLARHEADGWGQNAGTAFEMIAGSLPAKLTVDDAISSLLRPLFVPANGCAFAICDYAAVECRGIAWIAGETGLLHTLATGGDVYKEMASRIFGKPADQITDAERQVGKVTVLGCGYSMSAEKFRLYCGLQQIDLAAAGTTAEACVEAFRGAYPAIAGEPAGMIEGKPYRANGVWAKLAKAAHAAVEQGGIHTAGKTRWAYDGSTLVCELPSGRQLRYRCARIEDRVPGYARALGIDKTKPTLIYEGAFGESYLYGGKIAENVVQAICRDLLATSLVMTENAGLNPVLHVHDEVVCEAPGDGSAALESLASLMTTVPEWAAGFPIAVEGFAAPRYLKSPPKGWAHSAKRSKTI